MPKFKVFSGAALCRLLELNGFVKARQRGSHHVMQKKLEAGTITVPVPMYDEIKTGTLMSIMRQSGLARSFFEAQ